MAFVCWLRTLQLNVVIAWLNELSEKDKRPKKKKVHNKVMLNTNKIQKLSAIALCSMKIWKLHVQWHPFVCKEWLTNIQACVCHLFVGWFYSQFYISNKSKTNSGVYFVSRCIMVGNYLCHTSFGGHGKKKLLNGTIKLSFRTTPILNWPPSLMCPCMKKRLNLYFQCNGNWCSYKL